MPDLAVPPPTSLYPQPPSQQGALSSNPAQVLDLIGAITKNQMLQNELKARTAVGQAFQGALQPDNTVDLPALSGRLRSDPNTAWMAPQAIEQALNVAKSQSDLLFSQNKSAMDLLGSLPKNATDEEIRQAQVSLNRIFKGQNVANIEGWANYIKSLRGRERANAIAVTQNLARGPEAIAGRVIGPPGAGGEPRQFSSGDIGLSEAQRAGTPIGLPPGGSESALEMRADLSRAGQFGQEIFPWQQASDKIRELKARYGSGFFGPGSKGRQEFESYFYGLVPSLARNLGVSEDKLKNYAEAEKYLTQALQSRAAGLGADTNEKLATTARGSPNVGVTDLAVDELVPASIATMRAQQAQILQSSRTGGPNYTGEKARWSSQNDIRAFMLDLLPPEQRAKLLGSIKKGTPEYARFNNSLRAAYETGVMDRPGRSSEQPHPAATKAPDGQWYLPDPNRPGKYMRVTPSMLPKMGG